MSAAAPSDDINDPKVIAYRLHALESKVDSITSKLDSLSLLVTKNLCPNPGACLTVMEGMNRLEAIVQKHETDLQDLKLTMARASASFKTVGIIAGGAGSVFGVVVSAVVSWFTK